MGLLERIDAARVERRFATDMWLNDYLIPSLSQLGYSGVSTTWVNGKVQEYSANLPGYAAAVRSSPPAFAAEMVRALVISQARFTFRNLPSSRTPRRTFGTQALSVLERPWTNATTGELLSRMEWHAGLAGNAYVTNAGKQDAGQQRRLRILRPDWVAIIYGSDLEPDRANFALDGRLVGYAYCNGGLNSGNRIYTLLPDEVAHWSPIPDPEGAGIGMSWVSVALRDIQGDRAATDHKLKFFTNGATPNLVVKGLPAQTQAQFDALVESMEARHRGLGNAYRTLYLTAGADATVVGSDLKQLDFKATQGAGEPLDLATPIPTPTGWTTMGGLVVGDQVIGRNGLPANVVGVSPVHVGRDCFRITLKDRTSIVADASHLWVAVDRGSARRAEKQYTTQELYDLVRRGYPNGAGGYRMALPAAPIIDLPQIDLLVDPYVLGAWLGDGQTAGAAICGATEDLKYIASEIEARGYTTTSWRTSPDKVDVIGIPGGLTAALRALGVLGDKHIPTPYLRGSVAQRLDLLRGLMDTDGTTAEARGGCEFSSKDEVLARQVLELIRSLGYKATISNAADARSRTGCIWRIHFRVAQDRIPFLLPRKVDRCISAGDPHYSDTRAIVKIERVDSVPVRCIAVDTEDHLFLAGDGFVPTHNTRVAMLGRVPAPLLGISEGLAGSSLNAGNFGMARRIFADSWIFPTLQDLCGALAPLVDVPSDAELWFDTADMPILREDAKDAADIEQVKATTINSLITAGFTPQSAVAAVRGQDISMLVHTGLVSVQLQPPGAPPPTAPAGGAGPKAPAGQPAMRKFNPDQPRIPGGHEGGGRWGAVGALIDRLKLLGRIDLDKDESLLASGKLDADYGGARFALISRNGVREWRLGFGGEGFGQAFSDDDIPEWDGNPSRGEFNQTGAFDGHGIDGLQTDVTAAFDRARASGKAGTFGEGVIPGTKWGDIHWQVYLDVPEADPSGPELSIGVLPKDDPEWRNGRDWLGYFDEAQWHRLMRQIESARIGEME